MSKRARIWSRLATFGTGLLIKKALDYPFDYLLYPAALIVLGYARGVVAMTCLSVVFNLTVIRAYDWARRDFMMLESIKQLRESSSAHRGKRLLAAMLRKGDWIAFLLLSWVEDPIVVTLYLRRGAEAYDGLSRRDWLIFGASTLVSNLMWSGGLIILIEAYRYLR